MTMETPTSRCCVAGLAILTLLAPASGQEDPANLVVGPMVGHVNSTQATLWAYGGPNAVFEVHLWPDDAKGRAHRLLMKANAEANHAAKLTISNLEPLTTYRYRLTLNEQTHRKWAGAFRTAPPSGEPAQFTLAFSSCMHVDDANQASWFLMLAQQPAFHLLLGDNVYSDTTDHGIIWQHHLRYRQGPELFN